MILLGFADDVLDIRWKHKVFFSFLATVPLLIAYSGSTTIIIPIYKTPLYLGKIGTFLD